MSTLSGAPLATLHGTEYVGDLKFKPRTLTVYAEGVVGTFSHSEPDAAPFVARWDALDTVEYSLTRWTRSSSNAVTHSGSVKLATLGGARFALDWTDDAGQAEGVRLLAERAAPCIAARLSQRLAAGETVSFNGLQLGTDALTLTKERRRLPLAELAGWKWVNGHLLFDAAPASPRLWGHLATYALTNVDALLLLLEELAPGRNIDGNANYPVPSLWRVSAATYVPGRMSSRAKLIAAGVPLTLVALLLILMVVARISNDHAIARRHEAREGLARLAESQAQGMAQAPPPAATLAEACAAEHFDMEKVVVYAPPALGVAGAPAEALFVGTTASGWNLPQATPGYFASEAEHLVVLRLLEGALDPEHGSYVRAQVRLVNVASGAMRCEGVSDGHWTPSGPGRTRNVWDGLMAVVLTPLCRDDFGPCRELHSQYAPITFAPGLPPSAPAAPPPQARRRAKR